MDESAASGSKTHTDGGRVGTEFADEKESAVEPPLSGVKRTSDVVGPLLEEHVKEKARRREDGVVLPDPTSQNTLFSEYDNWGYTLPDSTSLATFFPYYDPASENCVLPDPASAANSSKTLELIKEVETPPQLRLLEHSSTGFNPVLVISCWDNQDSEETFFVSYIFGELCLRGCTPFRYDITRSTVTGNQEMLYRSRVGIMIVSKNYACSRKGMDEFVAIIDNLKANNVALLPVLFKVNGSNIHGQIRSFSRLQNPVQASQVLKWSESMRELISINRYHYTEWDAFMLAKNIVRDVCVLLKSETSTNLNGMRLQLKSILSLLNCSQSSAPHIVGFWGMAGIGKTTIAREIFRTLAERYDVCYFLPDFHRMCQAKGLNHLHDEFFSKIFGEEKVFIDACDTKLSFIRDRFLDRKVLIVLDGVSNAKDVEVFVGGFDWSSGGHTIILTSRNRQILVQCKVKELYEIPKLSESESFRLCCQYATEENWKSNYSLISELVNYANGNPLALRVLSSSLQKQCNDDKGFLRRLRQHPLTEIQDAFRTSFNALDDNEKNTFLDLACFFRGENKDLVVNILDGCGFCTDLRIYALIDESLVSLVDNMIEMPNIFEDMGRFLVCQEDDEAGKRSRLWNSDEIADVLTNKTGTEATEGIFLDASGLTFELSPTVFDRMYRLRLLKLHCPISESHCKICLPQGLDSLPDELRLLHWERYPLGSLPRKFNPKNLVELNMPYSNMTKLWKGTKNLKNLKRIILSHSLQLIKFPRLSKAMNLEHIDLEGCTSLVKVNSSILHHHKLTFLSLKDCSHLRTMPATVHLESLEVLNLSGCSELDNLQDFSPNLKELYLAGTSIREMPSSIGDLIRLVTLDLENCKRLEHLPPGINNLKAMMTLKLSGCSNLKSFPILDALFPRNSLYLDTEMTMEEFVPIELHSTIEESSDVVEPAFEYLSSDAMPYKRCRLKRVIETVILSIRKRKLEKSVSRARSIVETLHAKFPPEKKKFPQRPGEPECPLYMSTGNCRHGNVCKFHHPIDREAPVPPQQEKRPLSLYKLRKQNKTSSEASEGLSLDMLEHCPFMSKLVETHKLVETSTKKPVFLVDELIRKAIARKDAATIEQTEE